MMNTSTFLHLRPLAAAIALLCAGGAMAQDLATVTIHGAAGGAAPRP